MKFFSLFSGIGGFELGFERNQKGRFVEGGKTSTGHSVLSLGNCSNDSTRNSWVNSTSPKNNDFKCVGFSEIDKYAIQVYKRHFPDHTNFGDATRIVPEQLPEFDMLVGGFPCQSFSIAGKRKGMSGEDTRGTLFFEIYRIARSRRPKLLLLENVPGLLSSRDGEDFLTILRSLDEIGYDVEWDCYNTKDFRLPQNRERIFIVGHLRGTGGGKVFPIERKNSKSCIEIGTITEIQGNDILKRCYSANGSIPALNTHAGGNTESKFLLGNRIRRLTPTECERLQGFPDGWTKGVSDTQRYKLLGNAVTVNVIEAIARRILE